MDKTSAKEEIQLLVEKYNRIIQEGRDIKSKEEEMTKKDLIRPLFERVLGWDFEEDVTAEEKISKGWVDYGFRINDVPKFFLEAKALGENLDNQKFFEQALNYAYYKRCPWAVLTNFETIKILNAEWESPYYFSSHFMTIKCNEFLDRFNDLWLLSKEGFEQGSLDKLAERYGKKTKKESVDKQLLNDFTRFRDILSKNITKLNQTKKLTQSELDESIQRILDRLIFIRNCEDRGLEEKKLWEARLEANAWKKLKEVFTYYDKHYDSKLFTYDLTDPKKVHLCDKLDIDDFVVKEIIESLYRTKDKSISYDFSIIDADILGTVYEQYLSHILKKTERRATLTENHVHRKGQGIYYTPIYVVDYIVRSTLGELLKDDKADVEKIRVLDPACGSGSFLIKAFDVLNEHYSKHDEEYNQTQLDTTGTGVTYSKKLSILSHNIFGVDLDKQAVEIAQLNLLLKIAERGHRLPLLEKNIKCGNSLIDDETVAGDKAFQWDKQFEEIMKEGGFDAVIGNPPWLMAGYYVENQIKFLHDNYESATGKFDLYYCFIERGLNLLSENGIFGMIVPNKFFLTKAGRALRRLIIKSGMLYKVIDFGYEKVFGEATNYPCIILLRKRNQSNVIYSKVDVNLKVKEEYKIDLAFIDENGWYFENQKERSIFKKMESIGISLEQVVSRFGTGVQTGSDRFFMIDNEKKKDFSGAKPILVPILRGRDIRRYSPTKSAKSLIFPYEVVNKEFKIMSENEIKQYPTVFSFLESKKQELSKRLWFGKNAVELSGKWYGLMYLDRFWSFNSPHILTPSLSDRSNFTLGTGTLFVTGTAGGTSIIPKDCPENIRYFLGLLNSKIIGFYIMKHSPVFQGGYHKFSSNYLKKVPIKRIDFDNPLEKGTHDTIVELVDRMLSLNRSLSEIGDKLTDERAKIEAEIRETDIEIDTLVYKIYEITAEEKQVVEN